MSVNVDETIVPRWLPTYAGQKITDLPEQDIYKCIIVWNYVLDMLNQRSSTPTPSDSKSPTRTPLHLFLHEASTPALWKYHASLNRKLKLLKRRWRPGAQAKSFSQFTIDEKLVDACKQLWTGERKFSSDELATIDKHLQQELAVHPTLQSVKPVRAVSTEPKKSKPAAKKVVHEPINDSESALPEADDEDGDYPAGKSFVPTWMQRIGGQDVAELTQPELLSFLRQWNINLSADTSSEPVDRATKWRVRMRQSTVQEMQHRVGKLLQRLSQWQADAHASQQLLPQQLQQGHTLTADQTANADNITPSSHYPHGKHIIPSFIPLFGNLDVADLTVADMRYLIQQWNEDAAANLPTYKMLVMPMKEQMSIYEAIDVVSLWLHRLNEVRNDPNHVARIPARMRPIDLNASSAAQRQNRQQKAQQAEKAKQAAVSALVAAPTKSDAKKPGDNNKLKAPSTGNAASKPIGPQYEVRANPAKRLYRAQQVAEGWANGTVNMPGADANPSDFLGYNARDVYRMVKVIFRHLHKHKTARIDWTKVSADYLSTYAKVMPETECKLLWRYVAYRTRPNGVVERRADGIPTVTALLDDYNDSDVENSVNQHEQQTLEHQQIKHLANTNAAPTHIPPPNQPAWSVSDDAVLLDSLWHFSEEWRNNIVANWLAEASKKPEYASSFRTQSGQAELRDQLTKHAYQLPVHTALPKTDVNWSEVATRMSNSTAHRYQWPVTVLQHRWDVLRALAEATPQQLPLSCTALARALISDQDNAHYRLQLTAAQQPPQRSLSNAVQQQAASDHQMMQQDLTEPRQQDYVTQSPQQYANQTFIQHSPVQQHPAVVPMHQQQQYVSPVQHQQQPYRSAATPPTPLFNHHMSQPGSPLMTTDPLVNHCLRLMMSCGMQVDAQSVDRLNQVSTMNPAGNVEFLGQLETYLHRNGKAVPLRPAQVNEVIRAQQSIQDVQQQFATGGNQTLHQAFY